MDDSQLLYRDRWHRHMSSTSRSPSPPPPPPPPPPPRRQYWEYPNRRPQTYNTRGHRGRGYRGRGGRGRNPFTPPMY